VLPPDSYSEVFNHQTFDTRSQQICSLVGSAHIRGTPGAVFLTEAENDQVGALWHTGTPVPLSHQVKWLVLVLSAFSIQRHVAYRKVSLVVSVSKYSGMVAMELMALLSSFRYWCPLFSFLFCSPIIHHAGNWTPCVRPGWV